MLELRSSNSDEDYVVKVAPFGPGQDAIDSAINTMINHPSVQGYLKGTRNRLLSLEFIDLQPKSSEASEPPNLYRATFYDYTNNRAVIVKGDLRKQGPSEVSESFMQPIPNYEEFNEAVKILSKDPQIGPSLQENALQPYRPMPPLVDEILPNGRVERALAVGLLPRDHQMQHEIIAVNMIHQTIRHFKDGAPRTSLAGRERACGLQNAGEPTVSRGAAGSIRFTVVRNGVTLWEFIAVRPAASSGTNGSGIELMDVRYRGKLVLYQAHVPILNVQYGRTCGLLEIGNGRKERSKQMDKT